VKYIPLNFEIMSNPLNWVIVPLVVLFAGMVLATVYHPANTTEGN
jgi:hypothetical protein